MKKVLPLLLLFFLTLSSHADFKKNIECQNMKDFLTMKLPKSENDCIINKDLQKYISCRDYYEKNILNGLNSDGEESKDHNNQKNYEFFNNNIKKILGYELKKVKERSMNILCMKGSLFDFQQVVVAHDLCYSDKFISAFGSDSFTQTDILEEFKPFYTQTNSHLASKEKPRKKIELCDVYLECLSSYIGSTHTKVSDEVQKLYQKTMRECSSGYYTVTTTIKRKEESRKERRGNSMVAGPRTFITTNIVETKSHQIMYIDTKKGRVILLPLKENDSSQASLQSYKFDAKACQYNLVTDTQVDKRIRHQQTKVLRHNIGLVDDDKANLILQVRTSGLKKEITVSLADLENNGYVSKSDTYRKKTQRHGGISFGSDYDKKQDKAASLVLENIPVGKKGDCQVRSVHDGFIGEGPSQFDLSFEYNIEINKADAIEIEFFKSSSVHDQWEYRAVKKKEKKPSQFEEAPSGILDVMESQIYDDLSKADKQEWDDVADSEEAEEEFEGMTIDDLQMFTK